MSATRAFSANPTHRYSYDPPSWSKGILCNPPEDGRLHLANLPTPLYKVVQIMTPTSSSVGKNHDSIMKRLQDLEISLFIKRDDMTGGAEIGGNKIRKLEFLLAEALAGGYQSVVTIGGEQSNHCRATAASARMVGLKPHLILRTKRADKVQDGSDEFGFTGNILFDRMVGSNVYTCTPGEYGKIGSEALVSRLCSHLERKSESDDGPVYPIPVGGSNAMGTWGYINGAEELMQQWSSMDDKPKLDHVVFACGSGGTATGISLGLTLGLGVMDTTKQSAIPSLHGVGVCDDPDYFYDYMAGIANGMGFEHPSGTGAEEFFRTYVSLHQGKGLGYAASTEEELAFITDFAVQTGIVLDPVYTGKALYHFLTEVLESDPEAYRGTNILFWHTGGALGLFDKGNDLSLESVSPVKRIDVYNRSIKNGVDLGDEKQS